MAEFPNVIAPQQFTETMKPTASSTSEAADGTTHTFTNAPPSAVDDDDDNDDDKAGMVDVIFSLYGPINFELVYFMTKIVQISKIIYI